MSTAVPDEARSALLSEYLSLDEAARELRLSRRTMTRWLTLSLAPPSLKIGNRRYFRRAAMVQWLVKKETTRGSRRGR